jgi:hypothetical protein
MGTTGTKSRWGTRTRTLASEPAPGDGLSSRQLTRAFPDLVANGSVDGVATLTFSR